MELIIDWTKAGWGPPLSNTSLDFLSFMMIILEAIVAVINMFQ
jgi:hypothetical protein